MLTVAGFIIASNWKLPECPSKVECINKLQHIYVIEYYTATKMNKLYVLAKTWMNLTNVMKNKRVRYKRINAV